MNPYVRLGLALTALSWGLLFTVSSHTPIGVYWFSFVGVAWAFVAAGLVVWSRRPDNRTGRLLTLTGFLFLVPTLVATRHPVPWTIGSTLATVQIPVLFYLVLSYPRGTLTTRVTKAIFGYTGAVILILTFGAPWFFDPRDFGCGDCPEGLNLLLIRRDPQIVIDHSKIAAPLVILDVLLIAGFAIVRFWRATRPAKRVLWPVYLPVVYFSITHAYAVAEFNYLHDALPDFAYAQAISQAIVLMLIPMGFLLGITRLRARRARLGQLVADLGKADPGMRLQESVSRTLGDPSVEVGFWSPDQGSYLTEDGRVLDLPSHGEDRAATLLESEGQAKAAIVHDAALLEDPTLLEGVRGAVRLALDNERLTAEVRAQLNEVRASRQRIVEAADAERRRVERNLHDGAQQRLIQLGMTIRLAQSRLGKQSDEELTQLLGQASEELQRARDELRELAQGIHPAVLTGEGLRAAIDSVVELCPVPVHLEAPADRFAPPVEATAYFAVSEALVNLMKHSGASRATVLITPHENHLFVEVVDDGVGGADPAGGTGLRGLADRVAALDGRFLIESPPGRGTKVAIEIPCE